ncbi:hypothetical protein P8452_71067 [Trifolium repens]|nr:hypothetical protein P8452_71067 [Trifolium repens]
MHSFLFLRLKTQRYGSYLEDPKRFYSFGARICIVDETTKKYFTDAFMVHQFACGNRKKPTWIFPKTMVQPNDNDCGYYVMKNMIDIVSASVTKKWDIDEVFNDPTALSEDDLYELRNRWATCFLDLYNPENDYDDGAKGR